MSEVSEAIQTKCLAFGDRIIKLNDYLLAQAVAAHEEYKKSKLQKKGKQTSSLFHQTSDIVYRHFVFRQCASLVCTDDGNGTHCFRCL